MVPLMTVFVENMTIDLNTLLSSKKSPSGTTGPVRNGLRSSKQDFCKVSTQHYIMRNGVARYIEQMVESLIQEGIKLKPYDTPHGNTKEDRLAFDKILENKDSPAISKITFLQLMGKLVWPSSMTRPDVSMQVSTLCSCVSNPRQVHYDYALIVAGYLMEHKQLGITYGRESSCPLWSSKNANWVQRVPRPLHRQRQLLGNSTKTTRWLHRHVHEWRHRLVSKIGEDCSRLDV